MIKKLYQKCSLTNNGISKKVVENLNSSDFFYQFTKYALFRISALLNNSFFLNRNIGHIEWMLYAQLEIIMEYIAL